MAKVASLIFLYQLLLLGKPNAIKVGVVVEKSLDLTGLSKAVFRLIDYYANSTENQHGVTSNRNIDVQWRRLSLTNGVYASKAVCELMGEAIDGLVTVLPCRSRQLVSSQVDVFHLPHLSISTEPCEKEPSGVYTLFMTPDHKAQIHLLKDILSRLNWANLAVIYDATMSGTLRHAVIRSMTEMGKETTLIPLVGGPEGIVKLKTVQSKNLLIWAHVDVFVSLFHKAKVLGMTTSDHFWIVFIDDISLTKANTLFRSLAISNLLLVRRSRSHEAHCPTMDSLYCRQNITATLADSLLYYQWAASSGVLLNNTPSTNVECFSKEQQPLPWGSDLLKRLQQISLSGITNMQGFNNQGFPRITQYGFHGVKYNKDNGSIESLGYWRSDMGLRLTEGILFANRFQDFGNSLILIASKEERPFVVKEKIKNETVFTGFAIDILNELSDRLKFRYKIVESEDSKYGAVDEKGNWNGMIGRVISREVAMAVGPFAITSVREAAVDFTTPYWEDSFAILTLKSQSETGKLFQMMRPFTTDVWVSIAGAMIIVSLVSFLSSYFSPYTEWRRESTHISKKEASLKENFWIIYSSVIEQGPQFHPSGISSRCILGFWWLFTILIVSTYTANLAAFLTVVDDTSSINNLDELVETEDMGILVQDGGNVMTIIKRSNNNLYRKVWDRIQTSPSVSNIEEALEYVKTGEYAFIGMKSILMHFASESCGLFAVSKETFNSGTYGFVVPENAPYKELASFNIMKMLEGGLVDNWQHRWWPKVYNCTSEQNARTGSATSLQLDSLGGLFIVYCAITAAGFLSLVFEIAFRRCYPYQPTK